MELLIQQKNNTTKAILNMQTYVSPTIATYSSSYTTDACLCDTSLKEKKTKAMLEQMTQIIHWKLPATSQLIHFLK